jgi:hypothetical protein
MRIATGSGTVKWHTPGFIEPYADISQFADAVCGEIFVNVL